KQFKVFYLWLRSDYEKSCRNATATGLELCEVLRHVGPLARGIFLNVDHCKRNPARETASIQSPLSVFSVFSVVQSLDLALVDRDFDDTAGWRAAAISASISSGSVGTAAVITSASPRVTTTSSSMRMPMPRHFAATPFASGAM